MIVENILLIPRYTFLSGLSVMYYLLLQKETSNIIQIIGSKLRDQQKRDMENIFLIYKSVYYGAVVV